MQSAMLGRKYPIGAYKGVDGHYLISAGPPYTNIDLRGMFGEDYPEHNHGPFLLLNDIFRELNLYRALVKELVKQNGMTIDDPNEYHRGIASLAQKIGWDTESIRAIADPLVRELVERMLQSRPPKQEGLRKKRRRGRGRQE